MLNASNLMDVKIGAIVLLIPMDFSGVWGLFVSKHRIPSSLKAITEPTLPIGATS